MKKSLWLVAMLVLSTATLVACGDDSDSSPEGGSGGDGGDGGDDQDAGGGTGGVGGGGGMGGGGSGGTGGGGPVAMPVPCGSATCQPPTNPFAQFAGFLGGSGFMLPATGFACCRDAAAGECGYAMTEDATGDECHEPATPDTRCEDFMLDFEIPIPGFELPALGVGCCIDNQCGVDGQLFGQGCVENSEAMTMIAAQPMLGSFLGGGVPAPHACDMPLPADGGPDASDEDAGQ